MFIAAHLYIKGLETVKIFLMRGWLNRLHYSHTQES